MVGDFTGFKAYIFDFDGVIWWGDKLIEGADDTIKALRGAGKKILFVTNNSTKSRREYVKKLGGLGISADESEVVTSGSATAQYLLEKYGPSRVYAIGVEGLTSELMLAGHTLTEEKPGFVVVGHDTGFTYEKLKKAFEHVYYGKAELIAANDDPFAPREGGMAPVAGGIVKAIEYASGVEAFVVGKPNKPIMELCLSILGTSARETLMVGDYLHTDIQAGKNMQMPAALVLSGVSSEKDVEETGITPDFILQDITELMSRL